jgi:hypothetical protein
LRELIATKLGAVRRIEVDCALKNGLPSTALLIDWCADIMGQKPVSWTRTSTNDSLAIPSSTVALEFSGGKSSDRMRDAIIRQHVELRDTYQIQVDCEHGQATVAGRVHIAWTNSSSSREETLTGERSEIEIMIDQFCRRTAGGLNPVGRLSEYLMALDIAEGLRT